MIILKIIDRQPEINVEIMDIQEKLTDPEIKHIKSRTGEFPIRKLYDYLTEYEKGLLHKAIIQIPPRLERITKYKCKKCFYEFFIEIGYCPNCESESYEKIQR